MFKLYKPKQYQVEKAVYGTQDITLLLQKINLQKGIYLVKNILKDLFQTGTEINIKFSLVNNEEIPRNFVSSFCGGQQITNNNFSAIYYNENEYLIYPLLTQCECISIKKMIK